jgi:ubiquinone/menaquinone biosynthesis C-methylase UbiE
MSQPDRSRQWKRQAATVFESDIAYYDTDRENFPWYRTQLNFTMNSLAGRSGRVLDLGCAAGVEIAALRAAGFTVVGADFAHPMLLASHYRFAKDTHVSLAQADAEFLPFPDGSFDHVVCLGVLEYLQSYDRCLNEIHRVLRPAGIAVFSLPSRVSLYNISERAGRIFLGPLWHAGRRLLGRASAVKVPPHHRNLCIPWRFLSQLSKRGFQPLDRANTAFLFAPLARFWPAGQDHLATRLERFGRSRWLGWMGSQFVVAAQKRPARLL